MKPGAVSAGVAECEFYESYDNFIHKLPQSVRAAKILLHRVPIIWFSDDSGFAEGSFRNGCVYFSAEAITEKILYAALGRCGTEGEF